MSVKYECHDSRLKNTALVIFIRFPRPGKVKSRLALSLGAEKATNFYRLCAEYVFRESAKVSGEVRRYVFYSDRNDKDEIKQWAGPQFYFSPQAEGSLGIRIEHAFRYVFNEGAREAIILASDVPDISAEIINDAISALGYYDIVVGPAHDGGYYLLGMKRLHQELFRGISWSTEKVFKQTLSLTEKLGLTTYCLPSLRDIDTEADLREWMKTAVHDAHPVLRYVKTIVW